MGRLAELGVCRVQLGAEASWVVKLGTVEAEEASVVPQEPTEAVGVRPGQAAVQVGWVAPAAWAAQVVEKDPHLPHKTPAWAGPEVSAPYLTHSACYTVLRAALRY